MSGGLSTVLASVGRLSVRYRWLVVPAWIVLALAATALLPSVGSVANNDNAAFLPASSPSVRAQTLATSLLGPSQTSGILIASTSYRPLTIADQNSLQQIEQAVEHVRSVARISDGQLSADGDAVTFGIHFDADIGAGGSRAARAVNDIRSVSSRLAPPGLRIYLTGSLPELVDQQQAGSRTALHVELLSAVLILLLLLVAFRSTLAPLITLAPAGLALAVAGPVIAESTKIGVQISSLLELLLTALVLGAGTDYGLFLMFRYRENLQRGLEPREAIVGAVERVGESVAFSACTVIAALLTLLLASFGLYRGVGPGLAIGIAVVLLVEMTFFPALLAILGSAVFWPSVPRAGELKPGRWGTVAARVCARPVVAVVCGTALFGGLAVGLSGYAPSGFNPGTAIPGSGSSLGLATLEQHFGVSALGATDVVFRFRQPVWDDPYLLLLGREDLETSGFFSSVDDALHASGLDLSPTLLEALHRKLGPPQDLPATSPTDRLQSVLYDAYRSSAAFITADGRTVLYKTSLTAGSPGTTAALQAMPGVRTAIAQVAGRLGASANGVAGQAAGASDVASLSGRDIVRIAPVVLVVLALILALVLRSLIAPLYLVLSVALSYLASLGLAVILFVGVGRELGVNFTLPFFMFVFIMALGEDYNILVMTRVREEAAVLPLREAVSSAMGLTGTTVTSAGLVLSGTFGVLALGTSGQIRQIATGLALGILLDTFVVRTLLVPSTVVLVGRWNWWPSRMGRPTSGGRPRSHPAASFEQPEQQNDRHHFRADTEEHEVLDARLGVDDQP